MEKIIDEQYLKEHPNEIFVFGDNLDRLGYGGAAMLRDLPNTYGFITKKSLLHEKDSYYRPDEYEPIFYKEIAKFINIAQQNPDKTYLISRLGAGLANKYLIWEDVILPKIKKLLSILPNIEYLWDEEAKQVYYAYIDQRNRLTVLESTETSVQNKVDLLQLSKIALRILPILTADSKQDAINLYTMMLGNA